jgi:hypothetical protein
MIKSTKQSTKAKGASLPPVAAATTVTQPKRGRGRPRKIQVAEVAATADPVMDMVTQYRDIQNKIKTLTEELGPIKDALTRHLVAGEQDSITLPDGSYVITKVMTAHWTYSEKLEEKRCKFEEQRIDLKAAEKKEQLNGKAEAIFTAHVRGKAK